MASFFLTSLVAAGLMVAPAKTETTQIDKADPPVIQVAGVCDRAVEQALAMTGGELLSVQPARNGRPICRIAVLVVNKNGRPRKIMLRLPMDM